MSQLVYLVTGANKGIGYEATRILAKRLGRDAVILLGTRSIENGKAAIEKMRQSDPSVDFANVHPIELDVTKASSLEAAVEHVKTTYGSLHVLINNAGMFGGPSPAREMCFNVNVFGVYNTLAAFHPIMVPNSSVNIVVASEYGAWNCSQMAPELQALFDKFEQLDQTKLQTLAQDWLAAAQGSTSGYKWPDVASPIGPYGTSKTMVIAVTRKWAADHPEIKTMMVCPGWCATDLNNYNGPRQATQGGESVVFPIFNPDLTSTGGFYRDGLVHSFNTPRPAPQDYK
ncbi:unnamed protein product [Aphanomyces euteiches]|uniref:Uncharacterized protein n=1 Tax=Aphanomyces euteiches TaxID=100861 RepID=A0A6G0W4X4_9STRA|nr:hypothetical protein Ae201684_018592 [Aphanomyces euteiches]KAH9141764.1 hypothetical protein AeRB84_014094 [Aphanomyces euteiches]